jgi:hypothetical protein
MNDGTLACTPAEPWYCWMSLCCLQLRLWVTLARLTRTLVTASIQMRCVISGPLLESAPRTQALW